MPPIAGKPFLNRRFGRLLVLHHVGAALKKSGGRAGTNLYECLCDCGNTKIARADGLTKGQLKSCGCLRSECARKPRKWTMGEGESAFRTRYGQYARSAFSRGIPFNLLVAEARVLFKGDCYYCGIPASAAQATPKSKKRRCTDMTGLNGIDRLINDVGYESLNCVSCCWECNQRKRASSSTDFLAWVERIYLNRRKHDGSSHKGEQTEPVYQPSYDAGTAD